MLKLSKGFECFKCSMWWSDKNFFYWFLLHFQKSKALLNRKLILEDYHFPF